MPRKKTHLISVIIAVIIIIFILGGVIAINRMFAQQNSTNNVTNNAISSRSNNTVSRRTSTNSTNNSTSSLNTTTNNSSNSTRSTSNDAVQSNNTVNTTNNTTSTTASAPESQLQNDQMIATVKGTSGGLTSFEIVQCGKTTQLCKPGIKFSLRAVNEFVTPEINSNYKITADYVEGEGYITFNQIKDIVISDTAAASGNTDLSNNQ